MGRESGDDKPVEERERLSELVSISSSRACKKHQRKEEKVRKEEGTVYKN